MLIGSTGFEGQSLHGICGFVDKHRNNIIGSYDFGKLIGISRTIYAGKDLMKIERNEKGRSVEVLYTGPILTGVRD